MKNNDFKKPFTAFRLGFTLTELLVVILIIAVLAALSLFGMRRIRDMADKANSTRNLSQLQIANISYATDHNGRCVPLKITDEGGKTTNRWFDHLEFLGNLTGKPTDLLEKSKPADSTGPIPEGMLDPKVVRAKKAKWGWVYTSYGMNDTGIGGTIPNTEYAHNLNQVPNPSHTMAFATATDFRATYTTRYSWNFENPNDSKTSGGEIAYRHGGKVLAVYFDGHVGELSKADFERFDRAGGNANAFWKAKP